VPGFNKKQAGGQKMCQLMNNDPREKQTEKQTYRNPFAFCDLKEKS
jgi:hypothetical protein